MAEAKIRSECNEYKAYPPGNISDIISFDFKRIEKPDIHVNEYQE
jgi:hypothetical protein